jgi:hypothetical protein
MDYIPKIADLILVRGTSLIDRTIESVSHSEFSHVAGLVKPNELIEAQGFRRTGYQALDFYDGKADVFTCDGLTNTQRRMILAYVIKEVGTRYDWLLIGWEAVRYLLGILLPFREWHSRICSTLWADAYKEAGVDLCPGIRYPTPGDLAQSKLLRKVGSY